MSRMTNGIRDVATSVAVAVALLVATAGAALAQQDQPDEFQSWRLPGWTITPGVTFGALWDSNVAIAFPPLPTENTASDRLWDVEPFGQLEYYDARTAFSGGYRGFLRRYSQYSALNTLEGRAEVAYRERLTRRVTMFLNENYLRAATTDLVELNGVPFQRLGSRYNDFSGGVESRLTRSLDFSARYGLTWVGFEQKTAALHGGFVNGVHTDLTHRFSERVSFGGEYSLRWADLNQGLNLLTFQDAGAVLLYRVGPRTQIELAGGMAHLLDRTRDLTRTGPYVRADISHHAQRFTATAEYLRSYVPSLAFGGTNQSQEVRGSVQMPLSRNRWYVEEAAAWRRTDPFIAVELPLDSLWIHTLVGYEVQRWFRIEVYDQLTRQDTRLVHGQINRQLVGVQFVVAQPMRIR
jgi:hypothetical protein